MFKSSSILTIVLLLCLSCKETLKETVPLPDTGVALTMAQDRKDQVSHVRYDINLTIPENKDQSISGLMTITFIVNDLDQPLYLDFKEDKNFVKKVIVNLKERELHFEKEHLVISTDHLTIGANTMIIYFRAGELSLNRNDDYLYTLLVPDRARTFFPCFDQPDIKAIYRLEITAPKEWEVLCGAPLEKVTENKKSRTHEFEPSDKMSTYLFSFVAGKFEKVSSQETKRHMNMLYRETNEEKIDASIARIFELHQSSLDFLEDYTQVDFPFQKFDFATIPGFQYGGMEHTGAIQYRESSLFLDNSATRSQELTRAKLIAHETAHMWFGNLVTMEWFNDVWMKEVFANFMADKIVNPVFTDINHDLQFLTSHYPRAYSVDRTKGTNPIRQELDNLKNAGSLYGSIIYNKAPIMMRQLELLLGKEKFKEGIGEYIATYANGNADWNGLVEILDTKTDLNLKEWSDVWVNSAGRPVFSGDITYDDTNKIETFLLSQKAEDGSENIWPQSFEISMVYPDSIKKIPVISNAKTITIPEAVGASKPLYVMYNSNGYGYGIFPVSEVSKTPSIQEEVARAHTYLNLYEQALNASVETTEVFKNIINGVRTERNELILQLITRQLSSLYWNSFTEAQRTAYQSRIETVLYKRLQQSEPKNIKKILFNAYRSIAHSKEGMATMYRIWNKEEKIDNLVLNNENYTNLAQQLALYGHPDAEAILAKAKSTLTNPDKIKQFEFLEPSLDQDAEVRIAFFESFKDATNREKENWVQTACSYIHHPLHQKENGATVALSLELLEEVQQTGDIFFPLGWLNSTIGQYTSGEAYALVENYIASHPELDKNLKQKLLQATDNLYRRQGKR